MPKKWMQSVLMIVTYTVLLVLALVKFDWILALLGQVLSSCKPLFMGFAIAFVLNRPCAFFCRNYERNLGPRWKKLGRPLAVFTSYLVLIAAIVALFSFILPQVGRSLRTFAGSLNGYIANLQLLLNQAAAYLDWEALDLTSLNSYLREVLEGLLASITNAATHVMTVTTSIISMFVTLVLAVVFSIYMLAGKETLLSQGRRVLRAYLPARYAGAVSDVIRLTATIFTSFVSGQLIEACILGGLCAMGTFFIQADYAPLIGVIVGVSALIPVAGAYIGAILSGAGTGVFDLPVYPPADRGKCDLSPGGGYLHRSAWNLGADGGDSGRRPVRPAGCAAQRTGGLGAVRPAPPGCGQTAGLRTGGASSEGCRRTIK